MLGKRPHQIQRSTSMSQLRVPPGARTRPASGSGYTQGKRDCVSQNDNDQSAYMKAAAGAHDLQPNALEGTQQVEMKIESPQAVKPVNVRASPAVLAQVQGDLKAPHSALRAGGSSSPAGPLLAKHKTVGSFLDACFFCKRPLVHGKDIFMYRGDAAFCTEECRFRQISCDEKCSVSASQGAPSDKTMGNPKSGGMTTPTGAF